MRAEFRRLGRGMRVIAVLICAIALGGAALVADGLWSRAAGPDHAGTPPIVVKLDRPTPARH